MARLNIQRHNQKLKPSAVGGPASTPPQIDGHMPLPVGVPLTAAQIQTPPSTEDVRVAAEQVAPERQDDFLAAMSALQGQRRSIPGDVASPPTTPTTEDVPPEKEPQVGGVPKRENCQHCGWDLSVTDPDDYTDEDKVNYVLAVCGRRFQKTYELFGGRLQLTIRTLKTREGDHCLQQARTDLESGKISSVPEYFQAINEYRFGLSVTRVTTGGTVITLPEPDEYDVGGDSGPTNPVSAIFSYIVEEILPQEVTFRACYSAFQRFQRTVNKLAEHAADENFYAAIKG